MIKIIPNRQWKDFSLLFSDILERYEWFLFEFSKQFAFKAKKYLTENIKHIQGTKEYARRVVVAEMRSRQNIWFALTVKARSLNELNRHVDESLIYVVSTKGFIPSDPISQILESRNPWTLETLPFVPSLRQAVVTVKKASDKTVKTITRNRMEEMPFIKKQMEIANIEFQTRSYIMSELKIIPDLEAEINKMEFELNKKHWGPAIRKAKIVAMRQLMNDRRLLAAMTNCNFNKYKVKKHLREKIRKNDIRDFYNFQRKLTRIMAN